MRHLSIYEIDQQILWFDQRREYYFIIVDELTGEVGIPAIMGTLQADLCNTALRIAGSPWRWFKIEELELSS